MVEVFLTAVYFRVMDRMQAETASWELVWCDQGWSSLTISADGYAYVAACSRYEQINSVGSKRKHAGKSGLNSGPYLRHGLCVVSSRYLENGMLIDRSLNSIDEQPQVNW